MFVCIHESTKPSNSTQVRSSLGFVHIELTNTERDTWVSVISVHTCVFTTMWNSISFHIFFTARKRSLRQGNIFSQASVILSGERVASQHVSQVTWPGGLHQGGWADTPLPRDTWDTMGDGQQAGGAHPTGMLSCSHIHPEKSLMYTLSCLLVFDKDPFTPCESQS